MRYIRITGNNGYYGSDFEEVVKIDDNLTSEDIDFIAEQLTYEYAEDNSYLATNWDEGFETEEEEENYFLNALDHTNWEEITEEEYLNNIK